MLQTVQVLILALFRRIIRENRLACWTVVIRNESFSSPPGRAAVVVSKDRATSGADQRIRDDRLTQRRRPRGITSTTPTWTTLSTEVTRFQSLTLPRVISLITCPVRRRSLAILGQVAPQWRRAARPISARALNVGSQGTCNWSAKLTPNLRTSSKKLLHNSADSPTN